jgi:hypothetical protein
MIPLARVVSGVVYSDGEERSCVQGVHQRPLANHQQHAGPLSFGGSMDALSKVSDGTRMLSEAKTFFDAMKIADAAEAYRYAMKLAGGSEEAQRKASELKLRAERLG